jgi:cell division ATPase FtsA
MAFLPFWGKQKSPVFMVIDVGTHAIRALTFELPKEGKNPVIIKKYFFRMPHSSHIDYGHSGHHTLHISAKLREIIFEALKELGRVPKKIWIGVGPHLAPYSLETWSGEFEAKGKTITKDEFFAYFEDLSKKYRDENTYMMAFPVEGSVNRYPVNIREFAEVTLPSVGGKTVKNVSVEFRVIVLRFPKDVGHAFVEIKESLGGMPIEFTPIAAVVLNIIPEVLGLKDIFLIDVGGEETSLMLLRNELLLQFVYFPMGVGHFINGIAKITGASMEEAEDARRLYFERITDPRKRDKLTQFLAKESQEWKEKFLETRESFYHVGLLPEDVVLFGGGAALLEIREILRDSDWLKGFSYAQQPRVRVLDATTIFGGDTLGGHIQGPADVGLGALAYYAMKESKNMPVKKNS